MSNVIQQNKRGLSDRTEILDINAVTQAVKADRRQATFCSNRISAKPSPTPASSIGLRPVFVTGQLVV
jgi:hypothetical protein